MKTKEHFRAIAEDYSPKSDPWGCAMGAYFDVAAACYKRNIYVETYSPGLGGAYIDDDYIREYLDSLPDNELNRLARFCRKLTYLIDRAGRSY